MEFTQKKIILHYKFKFYPCDVCLRSKLDPGFVPQIEPQTLIDAGGILVIFC